jgi:predicted secreted protein
MDQLLAALDAGWRVLLVGLLLGAGLPAIFAFGVRALAWGTGGDAEVHAEGVVLKPHVMGRVVASTMFLVVIAAVLLGISYIVAHGLGYALTFNGILPVFTPK